MASKWVKLSGGDRGGMVAEVTNPAKDISPAGEFNVGEGAVVERYRLVEQPNIFSETQPLIEKCSFVPFEGGEPVIVEAQHAIYIGKARG